MKESSGIPQYLRIADELRVQFRSTPVGTKLKTEQTISEEYGVSRDTVRRALDVLVREGMLNRIRGCGTFRAQPKETQYHLILEPGFADLIRGIGDCAEIRNLSITLVPAPAEIAEEFGVPRDTKVRKVTRLRLIGGKPFAYGTAYLRADLTPKLFKRDFRSSLGELLNESLHMHIRTHHAESFISDADPTAAEALSVPAGTPILNLRFHCVDYGGEPILVDTFCFPPSQSIRFYVPQNM